MPVAGRGRWTVVVVALTAGILVAGCGSSLGALSSGTSTTDPAPVTTTTMPITGEVAVAFPVVACTNASGAPLDSSGWKPSILLAPIPTALVGKVEFYSDDVHTVVAPTGWTCTQTQSWDGGVGLAVYPSGNPNPPVSGPPSPGTQGVFATYDTTAHSLGIALVCPFFTVPSWQQEEAKCATTPPAGETVSMPTPDVASVTDPAGVVGSLEASGGSFQVTGTVIFPQVEPAVTDGSAVDVAEESCSLPQPALCATVLSDFDVREFPVPGGSSAFTPRPSGSEGTGSTTPTTPRPTTPTSPATTRTTPATPTTPTTPTTARPTTPPTSPPTTAAPTSHSTSR